MADPTQQLQQMLNNAESSFGGLNSAGQQLASALLQAAKAGNTQTNAATATSQSLAQLTARSQSVDAGFKNIGGSFVNLVNQAIDLTAVIYGADKAFTSVIPTVNAVASVLGKIITGMGQLGSGITILGMNLGKATEGVATVLNTGLDIVTNILKFQLETSQKVADQFISAAKVGALFGGSIARLGQVAADARVPIQTLVKVITSNAESLSKLGLGQEKGAAVVTAYTRKIFDSDRSLRILYGSFEELSVGVADYLTLQAQLGISSTRDYEQTKASATEYLYRQKELTAITGKNADLQKKEEEGRRNQLDYNLKLGRLVGDAKDNVQEGLALFGQVAGADGVKYLEEYFATGGKVITKSALAFQADMPDMAALGANLIESINQSRAGFRESAGTLFKEAQPALMAFARSQEEIATIQRAANNEILGVRVATASATLKGAAFFENLPAALAKMEADRRNMEKGPLDPATKAYTDAQNQLLINQSEIDKTVLKNMESIGETMRLMNILQSGFIGLNDKANELLNKIVKGEVGSDTVTLIKNFAESIGNNIKELANRTDRRDAPPTAPPTATPAGPVTVPAPAPPNPPGPVSQSNPQSDESIERTAALRSEIERLNREMVAIRNTPPPVNGENTDLQKSILAELQDHTNILGRMRDALA
jgi:hypothetical protein